jgi:hypothetical protein
LAEIRRAQQEKKELLETQKKIETQIQTRIKANENLLESEKAVIKDMKEVQASKYSELEAQKAIVEETERQLARKESLMKREEYISRVLETFVARKKKMKATGISSYFVHASLNVRFILKEAFLASSYEKTEIRERSSRKNNSLAARGEVPSPANVYKSLLVTGPKLVVSSLLHGLGLNARRS